MDSIKILWADDEIDLFKPQMLFLRNRGYEVITVTNGHDALEEIEGDKDIDIVFLDESMPGLTGLETLARIKAILPSIPVVMITKNEAEDVMEQAIGSQIADYLIKPVNPSQILLTLKKIVDEKRLVREKTTSDYQQDFRQLLMQINSGLNKEEWVDTYKKIINWELKLDDSNSDQMGEILAVQKREANAEFSKYVERNYMDWVNEQDAPIMSHNLMREKVFPHLSKERPTVMVLLDNMRYDQWKVIEPYVTELYRIEEEDYFYSILPTATQYSRNAIFAGMWPAEIEKHYKNWWFNDSEEGGKNNHEADLLGKQMERLLRKVDYKWDYTKVTRTNFARQMQDRALDFLNNDFSVIVYNFIDMLSHARTEMEVLKELAGDEKAYRSLTRSWFENSPLWATLRRLAERDINLIITTDHGTIRVNTPSRVVGDRDTSTNLRYKLGRNLQYEEKDVLEVREPKEAKLPRPNLSSSFIFAKEDKFFLYPNSYNYYNNYYRDTFQHGGISLEEIICPVVRLRTR
ncbi:response regulator receiver domain-containing protein [Neolewinella xylanilytica]|uniref:Response regulator receiver domain-containing protein n=1 Tax=Neolewinella xylanilytica TaxID=1514080 RepID=A0A2S6I1Q7_9BACT|nr:bifunctional response regulator/alkaline phosphatase family protein [Neolewinella xylanilytica]PPK85108.1 response regulator receiver domain-containing protein [Neolewinella xylanilytica]